MGGALLVYTQSCNFVLFLGYDFSLARRRIAHQSTHPAGGPVSCGDASRAMANASDAAGVECANTLHAWCAAHCPSTLPLFARLLRPDGARPARWRCLPAELAGASPGLQFVHYNATDERFCGPLSKRNRQATGGTKSPEAHQLEQLADGCAPEVWTTQLRRTTGVGSAQADEATAPAASPALAVRQPPPSLSHILFAVLTTADNHESRCRTVVATWGRLVPAGHLLFYSDRRRLTTSKCRFSSEYRALGPDEEPLSDEAVLEMADFGLFVDLASMCQKEGGGGRTPVEDGLFQHALGNLDVVYAHSRLATFLSTRVPCGIELDRGYDERGWTNFERSEGQLLRKETLSIDIGAFSARKAAAASAASDREFRDRLVDGGDATSEAVTRVDFDLAGWVGEAPFAERTVEQLARQGSYCAEYARGLLADLIFGARHAPLSPEALAALIETNSHLVT